MRAIVRVLLLGVAFGLVTVVLDWWVIPLVGGAWGVVAPRESRPATTAAAAAGLSWLALLLWVALRGPVLDLTGLLGDIVAVPGWALLALTLAFPMALAGGAALVGTAVRRRE